MEYLTARETIENTFTIVSETSFSEKKLIAPSEAEVDVFLDALLNADVLLNAKAKKIEEINLMLESLTWLNDLTDNNLLQINTLIGSAKDLHSVFVRQYVKLGAIRKKGLLKDAAKRFKTSIDDLKENIEDFESIFFSLPKMPGFVETTKQLSLI